MKMPDMAARMKTLATLLFAVMQFNQHRDQVA